MIRYDHIIYGYTVCLYIVHLSIIPVQYNHIIYDYTIKYNHEWHPSTCTYFNLISN